MSDDTKTLIGFLKSNGFESLEWDGSEITCYYPKNDEPFGAVEFTGLTHKSWSDLELSLSGHPKFKMSLKDYDKSLTPEETSEIFGSEGINVHGSGMIDTLIKATGIYKNRLKKKS